LNKAEDLLKNISLYDLIKLSMSKGKGTGESGIVQNGSKTENTSSPAKV
jgi:hypothetical protein